MRIIEGRMMHDILDYFTPKCLQQSPLAKRAISILADTATLACTTARVCGNVVLFGLDLTKNVVQEALPLVGRVVVSSAITGAGVLAAQYMGQSDYAVGFLSAGVGTIVTLASQYITKTIVHYTGSSEFQLVGHRLNRPIRWMEATGSTFVVLFNKQIMWEKLKTSVQNMALEPVFLHCPEGPLLSYARVTRWTVALISEPLIQGSKSSNESALFRYSTIATAILFDMGLYLLHYCSHVNDKNFFCRSLGVALDSRFKTTTQTCPAGRTFI